MMKSNDSATAIMRAPWNDLTFQPGWIAAAIPALVMVAHNRCNGRQGRMRCEEVGRDVGVALHNFPFFSGQRTGLVEHVIEHTDHAEIVQRSCSAHDIDLLLAKIEQLRQSGGELCRTKTVACDHAAAGIQNHGADINSCPFPAFRRDRVSPQNTPKPLIGVRS